MELLLIIRHKSADHAFHVRYTKFLCSSTYMSPYYQEISPKTYNQSINTKAYTQQSQPSPTQYSSTLTCPLLLKKYKLPHTRDIIFSAQGRAISLKWNGEGYVNPTSHLTTTYSIHWAKMATKENLHNITIMTLNHKH